MKTFFIFWTRFGCIKNFVVFSEFLLPERHPKFEKKIIIQMKFLVKNGFNKFTKAKF